MKKIFVQILPVLAILLSAQLLFAHPLGNFSVNQFSRISASKSDITIYQVLDLAEIPTFQQTNIIDSDQNGILSDSELQNYLVELTPEYISKLSLTINGEPLQLSVTDKNIRLTPGAGDLKTLRIEWNLTAPISAGQSAATVKFQNNNYNDRIGWQEIIVNGSAGTNVYNSSAFASPLSDELRSYPEDLLSSPLAEKSAVFTLTAGPIPENAAALKMRDGKPAVAVQKDRLAELIAVPEITPVVALFGLLIAFGLGAVHAMSPGHGKTVVGAYLVGSKGTAKHALFLGLTVTITHTLGVFALGLLTLFASNYFLPERYIPFLGFVSGLLVFFIGVSLFKNRIFSLFGWKTDTEHHHEHGEDEDGTTHTHDGLTHTHGGSTHTHAPPESLSWKNLVALGISGGLLPCPSALVLMLSAISLGRIGYGLVLTVAFSFGLAATLTIVGLIFLNLRNAFGKTSFATSPIFKVLPVLSAFVIACAGAVICYSAIA